MALVSSPSSNMYYLGSYLVSHITKRWDPDISTTAIKKKTQNQQLINVETVHYKWIVPYSVLYQEHFKLVPVLGLYIFSLEY